MAEVFFSRNAKLARTLTDRELRSVLDAHESEASIEQIARRFTLTVDRVQQSRRGALLADLALATENVDAAFAAGREAGEAAYRADLALATEKRDAAVKAIAKVCDHAKIPTHVLGGRVYEIVDIGTRPLTPRELFRGQGFPESYIIDPVVNGKPLSPSQQVHKCGNSVPPPVAAALVRANLGGALEMAA